MYYQIPEDGQQVAKMINNYLELETDLDLQPQVYEPYNQVYTHPNGHAIFLGDASAANDLDFIFKNKIGLVVTAAADFEHLRFPDRVQHIRYNLLDSKNQNLSKHFREFYEIVENKIEDTNILVHCFAGISRSATLVISYLMRKNKTSFKDTIAQVRKYRKKVLPNLGFEKQLKQYDKLLREQEMAMTRRLISKTSESRKHAVKRQPQIGLPDIFALGRTLPRAHNIHNIQFQQPVSQMDSRKLRKINSQNGREDQLYSEKHLKNVESIQTKVQMRSFRRRSISITKRKHPGDEEKKRVQLIKLPLHKVAIKQIKFGTEKLLKKETFLN